ncbi:MAG: PepSY-associated TM helix domain-containing protein [bacterium]
MTFRPLLIKLHLWVALATGVFLLIVAVSGIIVVFSPALDRAMRPELLTVVPGPSRLPLDTLVALARKEGMPAVALVPRDADESLMIFFMNAKKKPASMYIDQYTGAVLGIKTIAEQQSGFLLRTRTFHRNLLMGKGGEQVVAAVTALSIFMALTGLVLWWPRKIVRVKRGASLSRLNFDLHNMVGLFTSALLLVLSVTGVVIAYPAVGKLVDRFNPPGLVEPSYPAPAGLTPLSLDSLAIIGTSAIPGSAPAAISLPAPKSAVINMGLRLPDEPGNATRSRVWIDRFTGKILRVDNGRNPTAGQNRSNIHLVIAMLHTGVLFGWITGTLVVLGAVGQIVLVITGVLIWIKRTFRTPRPRAA